MPPDDARKVGEVQWPAAPPGDPRRDFVTVSADYVDEKSFVASVSRIAKQTRRTRALIFVHGFNNRFDDSRAHCFVQIVHDFKMPATTVLFTWPSRGEMSLSAYTYDRESANYSRDALERLIETLTRNPNITEVNILAHSMGNWVTLEALRGRSFWLAQRPDRGDKLKNAFLVAPDVDVDVFRTQIQRMVSLVRASRCWCRRTIARSHYRRRSGWRSAPGGNQSGVWSPIGARWRGNWIAVFYLTSLKKAGDDAHDRAFEDITSVMGNDQKAYERRPADRVAAVRCGPIDGNVDARTVTDLQPAARASRK